MKKITLYVILSLLSFICFTKLHATHIVGGEIYYDKQANNNYLVTLKVFRDCGPGTAAFDGDGQNNAIAYLHVFDNFGNLLQQIDIGAPIITKIPKSLLNSCIQTPDNVCVEEGKYTTIINLPPLAGGYHLVYQRCCRNNTILNLTNPGNQGSTYKAYIPGPELVTTNSSPRFDNFPPIFICNGIDVDFNHKATDPDGDVLVYSLCNSYNGLDPCCPIVGAGAPNSGPGCPNPPTNCPPASLPPPYPIVNFASGFSGSYPIASNPSLSINSTTGKLTGVPNINGQWVVSVCVQEFRNGNLLATHYRDFQFNVVTCTVSVLAAIADQLSPCQGLTLNFTNKSANQSNSPSYLWNFGDNTTLADTSIVFNPSYTYPDTGVYEVKLIVNPGKICTDTITKKVFVFPPLDIKFNKPDVYCVKSNSVSFVATGTFVPQTIFTWVFPASAVPLIPSEQSPTKVRFTKSGLFDIKLYAKQFSCIDSFIDTIRILDRPIAIINNFPTSLCDPAHVSFSNGSISEYGPGYTWETSDSAKYIAYEPSHVFSPVGVYGVTLTLVRYGVCPDTSKASVSTFTVNPPPIADFIASPTITSIFDPHIFFENTASSDVVSWNYNFADGGESSFMNEKHTYLKPGKYFVTQRVTNKFDCSNSVTKEIIIVPEFRFWIPNAFTPDANGLNDLFLPSTIGVSDYKFSVFDKWGKELFKTNDPKQGWDGTYKGKPCKQDVYVWLIYYLNDVSLKQEIKTGHVTLLKDEEAY